LVLEFALFDLFYREVYVVVLARGGRRWKAKFTRYQVDRAGKSESCGLFYSGGCSSMVSFEDKIMRSVYFAFFRLGVFYKIKLGFSKDVLRI
jgi:hypothetical protein